MKKIPGWEEGFTGLEAAIVLIAFVVVAAVFSYIDTWSRILYIADDSGHGPHRCRGGKLKYRIRRKYLRIKRCKK